MKKKHFKKTTVFTTGMIIEYLKVMKEATIKEINSAVTLKATKDGDLEKLIDIRNAVASILKCSEEYQDQFGGYVHRKERGVYGFIPVCKSKQLFPEWDRGAVILEHDRLAFEDAVKLVEKDQPTTTKDVIESLFKNSILLVKVEIKGGDAVPQKK